LPDPGPYPKRMGPGGTVIVMNTDDVDGRCAAAAKIPGVTMTAPPRMQEYPGRNGGPVIRVRGCNFFDPDGTLIEMNQILK
ncbi:MAG: VOC family protein, partial [Blastomonas fulva]